VVKKDWLEWEGEEGEKGKGKKKKGGKKFWGGGGNGLQGCYCLLGFLRPVEECKNPDWSDFMNYSKREFIVLIGEQLVIQEHQPSHIHSFNMAGKHK